ncbi:MAG: Uma2 family endonuclease [Chloroflexi bacterium]|nr:Uma2 family endonuclease [Chloroflexota bacterium]
MTANTKLLTADDLWQLPDDGMQHELVRGELRSMAPRGFQHGRSSTRIGRSLDHFVEEHGLGEVMTSEIGYRLESDPDTVRGPDVSFISAAHLARVGEPRTFFAGSPDLAVEVVSPNDRYTDVQEKVSEWLQAGARLVFVVDPRRRTVTVSRPDLTTFTLGIEDTLPGEDVVPGWSMSVRELFEQK